MLYKPYKLEIVGPTELLLPFLEPCPQVPP